MPRPDPGLTGPSVGLPPVVFLYTTDQIASMLNVRIETVMQTYLYFVGRSSGLKKTHQMEAINIAPEDEAPDWRVSASEFIKWLKRRGFKIHGATYFA